MSQPTFKRLPMHPIDISVVIPCFNEAANPLLEKTLQSILTQEVDASLELVVIDDGSTDKSAERITALLKRTPAHHPCRIITGNLNQGIARALNRGIRSARGRYILRIDCGDIALPGRVRRQFDYLEKHTHIALVGGLAQWIDRHGHVIGEYPFNAKLKSPGYNLKREILYKNLMVHATWMVRRKLYADLGYYNPAYVLEDYEFLVRTVSRGYHAALLPEYDTLIYMNPEGLTGGILNDNEIQRSIFQMKALYIGRLISLKNIAGLLRSGIGHLLLSLFFPLYIRLKQKSGSS